MNKIFRSTARTTLDIMHSRTHGSKAKQSNNNKNKNYNFPKDLQSTIRATYIVSHPSAEPEKIAQNNCVTPVTMQDDKKDFSLWGVLELNTLDSLDSLVLIQGVTLSVVRYDKMWESMTCSLVLLVLLQYIFFFIKVIQKCQFYRFTFNYI